MLEMNLGQIVTSKAGRDEGKVFIIVGILDGAYVQISDGDLRKIEKPKKKKIRHLEFSGRISEMISDKLSNGMKVTNAEIRKSIEGLSDLNSVE